MDIGKYGVLDASRTNEGITESSKPDPEVLPKIAGDWILVRPIKAETEKTASGIYIPDSTQGDIKFLNNVGRILSMGPRAYKTKDGSIIEWVDGGVKVGDIVQWERFVGKRMIFKGVSMVLLKDVAIQMVLESAEDVDTRGVVFEE